MLGYNRFHILPTIWIGLVACLLSVSCSSGVHPDHQSPSICVVDGPCEETLLLQCDCCDATRVAECKEATTAACGSGDLSVVLSVNECQTSNKTWALSVANGDNPCDLFAAARLEYLCPHSNVPKDPCDPNPCQNDGTCASDEEAVAVCTCVEGFEGDLCENTVGTDPCDPNPCQNEGTCVGDDKGTAQCTCADGFEGDLCENTIATDPCDPNPCQNEGTCVSDDKGTAQCTCADGFEGETCETVSTPSECDGDFSDGYGPSCCNELNEDPLSGGLADCVDGEWVCASGQLCTCNDQPALTHCVSACDGQDAAPLVCVFGDHWECMNMTPFMATDDPDPCQNGGVCSASESGAPTCECPDGFEGEFCETTTPLSCGGAFPNESAPGCCSEADKVHPDEGAALCVEGNWTCSEGSLCTCNGEVAMHVCLAACDADVTDFPTCVFQDHWECAMPNTVSSASCLPPNSE